MSFGFSIGDFFAVGRLAWSVYKSCKGAGGAFEEVSHEVISLHIAIKELEDEIENSDSIFNRTGAGKKKELGVLVQNCNGVLQQLNKLLIKYKSLGTGSKRAWDRLRWGNENLAEIREKIMSHTSSLSLFLTTLGTGSLGRIEKKLDQLIEDVRSGRREGTVLTMADNDEDEAETQWNLWKSELVDDGFSKIELEGHKHWIKARLKELIEGGSLHEETLPEKGSASKPSLPNRPKNATSDMSNTSKNLKQSDNGVPSTERPNLQPTVEGAEDDREDIEIREDVAVTSQESRHPESKGLSREEVVQEDEREKSDQELASEEFEASDASDSTDDTFLPSDSISNVGINTAETDPVLDTRTPQPLPSATKKTSHYKGMPAVEGRDFHYGFNTGGPEKGGGFSFSNPTRRKLGRASAENTGDLESEYVEREDRRRYETLKRAQPAKYNNSSALRREKSYGELGYGESSQRDNKQNETRQTSPRKGAPSDGEYYDSDPSDWTRPYARKADTINEEEPLRGDDRIEKDPIYDSRRVQHTARNTKLPSRPLHSKEGRYGDPRDDHYIDPRDSRYVDPWHDQYVASRDSRGTSTPTHNPRYFVPGNNQGLNYPPRPGPSDVYPPTNSNPTDPGRPGAFQFSTGPESGESFSFSNPESIFSEFLRGQSGMGGTNGADDIFANFGSGESRRGPIPQPHTPEITTIERSLPLTLEELFTGVHKKMRIKRKAFDEITGKRITEDKVLEMDIKPGLMKGTKIKFKGVYDEETGQQDLHFIVQEKNHPLFTREGSDLHHAVDLDLCESLCGWKRTITTIDGKQINIERQGPTPGFCEKYPNLGMPLSKTPNRRGCFIVTFVVKYPASLTAEQRLRLKEILG